MADDVLKFDVRVRERLLNRGVLKESELAQHLESLEDVAEQSVPVVAKQPALQSESDRDIVIVRTSSVRAPAVAPRPVDDLESTPLDDDDDLDDELDDDDDDDDELEAKAAAAKPAPKPEAPEAPEAPAAPATEAAKPDLDDDWGDKPA